MNTAAAVATHVFGLVVVVLIEVAPGLRGDDRGHHPRWIGAAA